MRGTRKKTTFFKSLAFSSFQKKCTDFFHDCADVREKRSEMHVYLFHQPWKIPIFLQYIKKQLRIE